MTHNPAFTGETFLQAINCQEIFRVIIKKRMEKNGLVVFGGPILGGSVSAPHVRRCPRPHKIHQSRLLKKVLNHRHIQGIFPLGVQQRCLFQTRPAANMRAYWSDQERVGSGSAGVNMHMSISVFRIHTVTLSRDRKALEEGIKRS